MRGKLQNYWRKLADGTDRHIITCLLLLILLPAAFIYGIILRLRYHLYRLQLLETKRLPRPVISIGNITVGGTGKTPLTALVAEKLITQGFKVAVLSRGYGGNNKASCALVSDGKKIALTPQQSGDEPYLLARNLPGLAVLIGADRHQAGMLAMKTIQPDLFLLDDGFQHLKLHRDLNILLLDCKQPFGNGLTLPAGLLREPLKSAARANLLILTRCTNNMPTPAKLPKLPYCRSCHQLTSFCKADDGTFIHLSSLTKSRTVAFAGIANPGSFFAALQLKGITLAATLPLPDHEPYHNNTLDLLQQLQLDNAADWLLTTEKDAVKLGKLNKSLRDKVIVAQLTISLEDEEKLDAALLQVTQTIKKDVTK